MRKLLADVQAEECLAILERGNYIEVKKHSGRSSPVKPSFEIKTEKKQATPSFMKMRHGNLKPYLAEARLLGVRALCLQTNRAAIIPR